MQIDKILAGVRATQTTPTAEKTAAEKPAAPVSAPHTALNDAMKSAVAATEKTAAEKVASAPVNDVLKIASELAASEKEVMIKEAQMLGAAFADAAIARVDAWKKTASVVEVAPATPTTDPEFSKFAAENPEMLKQAKELGYQVTRDGINKMADDAYTQGYNDTVASIHKTASLEFLKAASTTHKIIEAQAAK